MTSQEVLYFVNMVNIMVWLVFCLAISKNKMLVMNFMSKEVKIENYRLTTLKWGILRDWLLKENPPVFFKPLETEKNHLLMKWLHWPSFMILKEKLTIFCFIAYFAVCPFLKWSPCKRLPVMIIFLLQELQLQCLSMFCHKEIGLNQYYQMKIQEGRFGMT